jgi:hypothetical protein
MTFMPWDRAESAAPLYRPHQSELTLCGLIGSRTVFAPSCCWKPLMMPSALERTLS